MTFHYMLMACQAVYSRRLMEQLSDTGMTWGQPKVLDYLEDHDGASQREIAAHCYIEPASLTSVLNGMETKGLIERRRMNGDRRSYHIYLTETGREHQRRVGEAFMKVEADTFSEMSKEKTERFMELFEELYERLTTEQRKTEKEE